MELADKNDFKLEDKIDRNGFEHIHVLDWPLVLYNGFKQTLDMVEDNPLRQDYCPWCRGYGMSSFVEPDFCPACRGTGLVGPRQQCFLLDRLYARLNNHIYPDWPIWNNQKYPIPAITPGQWNNFDFVMSARGRVLEAMFDYERRKIHPNVKPRILFPPPGVEEVIKQMKIPRHLFPPKHEQHIKVRNKGLSKIQPENKPVRTYLRSPEEIKLLQLKPYQLKVSTNKYGNYLSCYESRIEVENRNLSSNEKIDENCLSVNENNSVFGLTFSLKQDSNAICQKSYNEIRGLQRQIQVAECQLKTLKEERLQMQAQCDDNVTRKKKLRCEESLMNIQENIVRLERDLDETTEKLSMQKRNFFIPQVAQFPNLLNDSKFDQNLSASEIKFTQVRCFVVKPGINKGEWKVSSRSVNLSGIWREDGKKDRDLTPNDRIMGMTLAQDDAFFTPKKTIRSDPVIKIISN